MFKFFLCLKELSSVLSLSSGLERLAASSVAAEEEDWRGAIREREVGTSARCRMSDTGPLCGVMVGACETMQCGKP